MKYDSDHKMSKTSFKDGTRKVNWNNVYDKAIKNIKAQGNTNIEQLISTARSVLRLLAFVLLSTVALTGLIVMISFINKKNRHRSNAMY